MCTKSYYCSRILKTLKFWLFMERQINHLKKNRFENFPKRLTLQVFFRTRLEVHYCSCVLKTFKTWVFLEKKKCFFFSKKHFKVFKKAKHGYFALECLSISIFAQENSKRSTAWDFPESRWVISKNCLIYLNMADNSNIFIECVSNGIFALKISDHSNIGFSWKNKGVFSEKKLEFFVKIEKFGKLDIQTVSKCDSTQTVSNRLEFGFFRKNI